MIFPPVANAAVSLALASCPWWWCSNAQLAARQSPPRGLMYVRAYDNRSPQATALPGTTLSRVSPEAMHC